MLLVAQRVLSPTGARGTNAFVYLHGNYVWDDPPSPGLIGGELIRSHVEVAPPGNRVASYLDVLAPDEWTLTQVDAVIAQVCAGRGELPGVVQRGAALVRFDIDRAAAGAWRSEVQALYAVARATALASSEIRP
ncbi:MAG: hypothetical protein A2138_19440 [Deltaproteobacteria bacterium RBG_16_71_12]|nr:MAG: hypothetical protein A2138_19440 [Deltaproteobacteria bacterium RBG_16_71_12]